jgi:pimeloyl-ACP methyl ester carboxylesterase
MDKFEHKTVVTKPFDLTYSYYLSPNFHQSLDPAVPTLVFSHGYPDDAFMWEGAVPSFLKFPYPMVILDILGLGGSSKPTDASKYNYRQQANSIAQILDKEGVGNNVIPIGHDWGKSSLCNISSLNRGLLIVSLSRVTGSAISQRFYLYHKKRCVGLVLLSLAYQIPTDQPFDLDEQNKLTAGRFGYPQWEYWNFFTAPDAPKLMEADPSRMYEVNHGLYPSNIPEENGRDIWMREVRHYPAAWGT